MTKATTLWEKGAQRLAEAGVRVGKGVRAWLGDDVRIGSGVAIGDGTVLVAEHLEIGDDVRIGDNGDLRGGHLSIGARSELLTGVQVLAADTFAVGEATRIEESTSITCRSFQAGQLLYLGHHSSVGYGGTTASTSLVRLGDRVALGPHTILNANQPITFEDQVGSGSYLSVWTHGYHFGHRLLDGYGVAFAPVHVERNVWLGYHVTVLPGVRIGANTILAAGAVAARDLPADVLAAGVPAVPKRPLAAAPLASPGADQRIVALLDEWLTELAWKGIAARRHPDGVITVGTSHRVVLLPKAAPIPADQADDHGPTQLLLCVEDRPDLRERAGERLVVFELRSGGLAGTPDGIGHDLRDFLRRNALPCGDRHCFRSLPAEPFQRLLHPERAYLPIGEELR